MNEWLLMLLVVVAGSLISLSGGLYMLYGGRGAYLVRRLAVPFAAGALLAAAFLELLPEAIDSGNANSVMMATLFGILFFFLLERGIGWFHHHEKYKKKAQKRDNVWLIVIGDTLHNFIDGLTIGAAFLISPATGVVAAIATAAHEIPQEVGDFGLMLDKGMSDKKVILVNIISGLVTVVGAALVYGLGDYLPVSNSVLLAVAAGFFIYIAVSDIMPTIHSQAVRRVADIQTATLLLALVLVASVSHLAHQFVDHGHDHDHGHHSHSHQDESHTDEHDDDDHHDHEDDDHAEHSHGHHETIDQEILDQVTF